MSVALVGDSLVGGNPSLYQKALEGEGLEALVSGVGSRALRTGWQCRKDGVLQVHETKIQSNCRPEGIEQVRMWRDAGLLGDGVIVAIDGVSRNRSVFVHSGRIERGSLAVGDLLNAQVDRACRRRAQANHTATHLLHAALRAVLGPHVRQAGSLVAPDRLRFDFTHPEPLKPEELERVELLVNRWIMADFPVTWRYMPLEEARKEGAMALFGEKYGEVVRVVRVEGSPLEGLESKELCGGCHVRRTGEIGAFLIRSEEAVSAGVRRIEAVTGEEAIRFARGSLNRLKALAERLEVARGEMGAEAEFDHRILNDDASRATHELVEIIRSATA